MSTTMAEPTATANIYLQQLKAAAEAQMRRSAPQLDGAGAHKKQKVAENDQLEQSEHVDGPVGRYAYAAPGALTQGCTAFLGSCGFRRERSSTKEVLDILHKVLPTGTKFELAKVGCNGLVVIAAEAAEGQQQIDPTATVQHILERVQSGDLQRTKFCQRIMPAQATCALTATALTQALTTVVTAYIKQHLSISTSNKQQQQQRPVEFAVAYKNRDNVTVAPRQESSCNSNQQQLQGTGQQQAQQAQRQQQQEPSGALQPVPDSELVDRSRAIHIAAGVMEKCCSALGGAKANLVNPQVVLLLEVIPLARHQLTCAVAAVPASMMVTKPKLAVKPIGAGGR